MLFKLEIEVDNAAFEEPGELARCLRKIADRPDLASPGFWRGGGQFAVLDSNGNTVGHCWAEEP